MEIKFTPIGYVSSPYGKDVKAPKQGISDSTTKSRLIISDEYIEAASDIKPGEKVVLLFFFHESEGYELKAQRGGDGPAVGMFSTRTPRRPNPIGMDVVEVTENKNGIIEFLNGDMLDGTPVIDIKPFI